MSGLSRRRRRGRAVHLLNTLDRCSSKKEVCATQIVGDLVSSAVPCTACSRLGFPTRFVSSRAWFRLSLPAVALYSLYFLTDRLHSSHLLASTGPPSRPVSSYFFQPRVSPVLCALRALVLFLVCAPRPCSCCALLCLSMPPFACPSPSANLDLCPIGFGVSAIPPVSVHLLISSPCLVRSAFVVCCFLFG